jgi:hypothetical protein
MEVRRIVALAAAVAFAIEMFIFGVVQTDAAQSAASAQTTPKADQPAKNLQPESRLLLIRGVGSENAKLVHSLPAGKHGFILSPGKPLDMQHLKDALRLWGTAAGEGDTIQITGLEFHDKQIRVQINGGGKKHFNWRQHLQIGMGNVSTPPPADTGPRQPLGGVLILDYGRPVPDMSPDDLKRDLSMMLDFSKQQSAAVNWIDTIPPKFKQAITDHKAMVGMDEDMVIAAVGRPDHKVRQRETDGKETEDWIYGTPPARTVFVTFAGDNVIRVREFN